MVFDEWPGPVFLNKKNVGNGVVGIINRESKFYNEFYDYLNNTAKDKKAVDAVRILLMALIRAEDELCLEMNEEELKSLREKWGEYVEKLIEISK